MKKLIAILAALMLLISGCVDSGNDGSNSKDNDKKEEKEVVQLNDAEELPYYSYYVENGDKVSFNRLDKVELLDISPEVSFKFQNNKNFPDSVSNVMEEEYVVLVTTFNGQRRIDGDNSDDVTLQAYIGEFADELKFVKGDEILDYPYVDTINIRTPDRILEEIDGMYVYSEVKKHFLIKREYLEDENIQIRLPEYDKWIYFDIER